MPILTSIQPYLTRPNLINLSILLRLAFLLFGLYQDQHMSVKYTDIDYLVFTDAARYVHQGMSPYLRDTYRYTPLLSWMLIPNETMSASFGKVLFIACDLITGLLIVDILNLMKVKQHNVFYMASLWLLNPMVVTISTRGSSESVLTVFVMIFIYYLIQQKVIMAGLVAGLAVHFKIYPIIYIPTAVLYLTSYTTPLQIISNPFIALNKKSLTFLASTIFSFITLSLLMYHIYGQEFLHHTYLYHLTRSDHRHNFSLYNMSLFFTSNPKTPEFALNFDFTKFAFVPQLALSAIIIPLVYTKRSLNHALLLQTLTFVAFNKVMTSQYFIWFLIFLPLTLSRSSLLSQRKIQGSGVLLLWIAGQALWLYNAYRLEFLGEATFYPELVVASAVFFFSNLVVIGAFIDSANDVKENDGL